jgi:hypothetical protein
MQQPAVTGWGSSGDEASQCTPKMSTNPWRDQAPAWDEASFVPAAFLRANIKRSRAQPHVFLRCEVTSHKSSFFHAGNLPILYPLCSNIVRFFRQSSHSPSCRRLCAPFRTSNIRLDFGRWPPCSLVNASQALIQPTSQPACYDKYASFDTTELPCETIKCV